MAEFIRMPAVMANATDAVLSEWLVRSGETIAVGDPIAEIETDKAIVEYAAEIAGTIGRLLVEAGTRVAVGAPIVVVLEAGEDASAMPADAGPSLGAAGPHLRSEVTGVEPAGAQAENAASAPAGAGQPAAGPATADEGKRRIFATPIARRVATQLGIDLTRVTGTGPNGRIVRRDVDAYRSAADVAAPSPTTAPIGAGHRDVPLTGMRRAIAHRLAESKASIPHFYVTAHIRADRLLTLRQEVNHSSPRKVSVNDFVVKAVAAALEQVPAANASWNGDSIRYFESVDVAVAVAIPDGLLTPVVRGIERLRLTELSAEIARLVESARNGRLQQHELEGGSFAVSNLGMHGVDEFSAIINPPQAGILAVAAAKPQPVVEPDGQLGVGQVMAVTLSADHRVIDGALAAEWVGVLTDRLQDPVSLLL